MASALRSTFLFPSSKAASAAEKALAAAQNPKTRSKRAKALATVLAQVSPLVSLAQAEREQRLIRLELAVEGEPGPDVEAATARVWAEVDRLAAEQQGRRCSRAELDLERGREQRHKLGSDVWAWVILETLDKNPRVADGAHSALGSQPGEWTARLEEAHSEHEGLFELMNGVDPRCFEGRIAKGVLRLVPRADGAPSWASGDVVLMVEKPSEPGDQEDQRVDASAAASPGWFKRLGNALGLRTPTARLEPRSRAAFESFLARFRRSGGRAVEGDSTALQEAIRGQEVRLHANCPECVKAVVLSLDPRVEPLLPLQGHEWHEERSRRLLALGELLVDEVLVHRRDFTVTVRTGGDTWWPLRFLVGGVTDLNAIAHELGRPPHYSRLRSAQGHWELIAYLSPHESDEIRRTGVLLGE